MATTQEQRAILNNVGAVIAEFFANTALESWYEAHSDKLEGFSGVVAYVTNAGMILNSAVEPFMRDCDECYADNFDWTLTVEQFAQSLIDAEILSDDEIKRLAIVSLER